MSKKIIFSHGEKGGVGKSMIATLIANHLLNTVQAETILLIEGDTGIPDVAARYKDKVKTVGVPLQRGDLAVEAIGELFAMIEDQFESGIEYVLINLPAGASATIDKHATDLIAPVSTALSADICVSYALGPGVESARGAENSLKNGLCGIADKRVAVLNSALADTNKFAWSKSEIKQQWLESGGDEFILSTMASRVADSLHELDGTLSEIATGSSGLHLVDRMVVKKFIDDNAGLMEKLL